MRAPMRPDSMKLLDASITDADQREFGGCEEGVGCHQEQDQKDPEQHESDHWPVILNEKRVVSIRYPGFHRIYVLCDHNIPEIPNPFCGKMV